MVFEHPYLLSYGFLPGPLELAIIVLISLLFLRGLPPFAEFFEEVLRRDPQLRRQWQRHWFLHAWEAESRADRTVTLVMHVLFWGAIGGLAIICVLLLLRNLPSG